MKWPLLFAGAALLASLLTLDARSEPFTLYTTDAPPMTMTGAELSPNSHGFIVDIVQEAARRSAIELDIQSVPWRRAQTLVATGENLLITPLSRIPSRENSYSWIAPMFHFERAFATIDKRIDSFDQAKRDLKSILIGKGTSQEATLIERGFPDALLHRHEINVAEIEMMLTGRADGWFNGIMVMQWRWHRAHASPPLVIGTPVDSDEIYLACSKSCSQDLIVRLRIAIERMRADGTFRAIQGLYLDNQLGIGDQ